MAKKRPKPVERDSYEAYFPTSESELAYREFLQCPGESLGIFLGDAPAVEQRLTQYRKKKASKKFVARARVKKVRPTSR